MADILYSVFVGPFAEMASAPDLLLQVLWEGFVSGTLYALIALGFVLIFKASGVFNFAQGIMVVLGALSIVGLYNDGLPMWITWMLLIIIAVVAALNWKGLTKQPAQNSQTVTLIVIMALLAAVGFTGVGVSAWLVIPLALAIMYLLAVSIERVVLRHLVNQPDIILFMATIGLTYFLIGFGEFIFGGEPKTMITTELGLPTGSYDFEVFGGFVSLQQIDIAAAVIAAVLVAGLAIFFSKTRIGRALRAVADDHQAAMSVGITLKQIWIIVWFAAGIVALATGIMWGARSDVSFALSIVALKALPVLILGGLTSVPGAIVGGLIIGISEKLAEFYWGPLVGGSIESWFPYFLALIFLWFRPQGLFGEKIIERV